MNEALAARKGDGRRKGAPARLGARLLARLGAAAALPVVNFLGQSNWPEGN